MQTGASSLAAQTRYRSILVAIDDSEATDSARRTATRIARRDRSRMTLIAAYQLPRLWVSSPAPVVMMLCSVEELRAAAQSRLERALAAVDKGIPVAGVVREGELGNLLVRRALCAEHDLIVLGTTNPVNRLRRRLMAIRVSKRSGVPVLLAHTRGVGELVHAHPSTTAVGSV
jgi:nucleotide-binding universal stress UspA family protein